MLSVSRLINVSVALGATPVVGRAFNCLMVVGDSAVISGLERYRSYTALSQIAADFGVSAPEYLASSLYYGQSPKPVNCMVGRWLSAASSGYNLGMIQSAALQTLSLWQAITTGAFKIAVDSGAVTAVTTMDFSAVTNLNGVATIITTRLGVASLGAVCTWNGTAFVITSSTTGPGAAASGSITLTANPAANNTITVNGTLITFVASSPVGSQVVLGSTAAITLANLLLFLQQSVDTNIQKATYAQGTGLVITVSYQVNGTAGNSFTLAKVGANITISGAVLSGGTQPSAVSFATSPDSGADISAMLGLTSATSQGLANGYALETPAACAAVLDSLSSTWYGLTFAATASITSAQHLAVAAFVEGADITRMYGISTQDTGSLSALVSNDIGSLVKSAGYSNTFVHYSSTLSGAGLYPAASMFGRMFSVDFNAQNSTIELMYKQMPGVTPESLTNTQANALQSKHINVFVGYDNGSQIIQYGTVGNGDFIDEIWGLDWFQNAVQTVVFNLLYTATTKIPQTDAGQNQLLNSASSVCGNQPGGAVYNGLAGPGTWNSSTVFGTLKTGQFLPLGYYIFAASVNSQAQADRSARVAPPMQIALKLAGAFQEADVLVTVNQ